MFAVAYLLNVLLSFSPLFPSLFSFVNYICPLKENLAEVFETPVYNCTDYFMLMNELSSNIIFHFLCPPGGSIR